MPQRCTSVLEAVVKKAGFPARWEGVRESFLGIRIRQGDATVILIVRNHLWVATQHTCTQFSWQMAMWWDKPLPDHVLRNHRVIFPRKMGTWSVRLQSLVHYAAYFKLLSYPWSLDTRKSPSSLPRKPLAKGLFSIFNWVIYEETNKLAIVVCYTKCDCETLLCYG